MHVIHVADSDIIFLLYARRIMHVMCTKIKV